MRPYAVMIACAIYVPFVLFADLDASVGQQYALGAATLALLIVLSRQVSAFNRQQIWVCVAVSTCIEVFATQLWGVYQYRHGNVPLYVPPGHGLVCLFGLCATRSPAMVRYGKWIVLAMLGLASAWAIAGLTLLPRWTGRLDVEGALFLPWFAWLLLRTERKTDYAATFFIASMIEIVGTIFHTWEWSPVLPYLEIPCGNPPSVAAGGYCWFSAIALALVTWWHSRRRQASIA
jgi:hypothetical protein